MRLLVAVTTYLALVSTAHAKTFFTIPTDYEKINSPPSEVVVANPFPKISGKQVNGVRFSFDGSWHENECSTEDRGGNRKLCGKAIEIQPGAHVFYAMLCTKSNCGGHGEIWHGKQKITVGISERVTIDLSKEGAITRKSLSKKNSSPCVQAIEKAFYENTCRAEGVNSFAKKLEELHTICSKSWSKNTDLLLEMAAWQASYLHPDRCYFNDEIKKLPKFLTSWSVSEGFWPKGTLDRNVSSWSWARASEDDLFSKYSGAEFRKKVREWVKLWAARQEVVDQLIDTVLTPSTGIAAITQASANAKFDMNPATPAGHRNFGLSVLARSDGHLAKDPRVGKVLAQGASAASTAQGGKIHCALMPEVTNLVQAMIRDEEVSSDDWTSIQGFLKRTPADSTMQGCKDIIDSRLKGVPAQTRFLTFATYDCAKKRKVDQRGKTISLSLDPRISPKLVPPAERLKLLKKFRDCISFENGVDGEKVDKKKLKGFDIERYYYETGDLRRIVLKDSADRWGKSMNIFYRPDGFVTRASCNPGYLHSLAACKPLFPFDLDKLPALTK